jgi:hypothetical protein
VDFRFTVWTLAPCPQLCSFPFALLNIKFMFPGNVCWEPKSVNMHLMAKASIMGAAERLHQNCERVNMSFHGATPRDGNCFYHAVSDQLFLHRLPPRSADQLRNDLASFLVDNPVLQVCIFPLFSVCPSFHISFKYV